MGDSVLGSVETVFDGGEAGLDRGKPVLDAVEHARVGFLLPPTGTRAASRSSNSSTWLGYLTAGHPPGLARPGITLFNGGSILILCGSERIRRAHSALCVVRDAVQLAGGGAG